MKQSAELSERLGLAADPDLRPRESRKPGDASEMAPLLQDPEARLQPSVSRLRRALEGGSYRGIDLLLASLSAAVRRGLRLAPRRDLELVANLPYREGGSRAHLVDVYRPIARPGPWPIVLYVHGGGFTTLSKDTHWMMAEQFARQGYLVFNINYRLAPLWPFPAALEDTISAYLWMLDHAASFGGDLDRIVVAGESAGANLITGLSIASCYRRPEPYAAALFERERRPDVAVPACGVFQVSDISRLARRRKLPIYIGVALVEIERAYLRGGGSCCLADPLCILEQGPPDRELPAFFLPVGTRDPLLDDTRRLAAALLGHGAPVRARYYPGEMHAFHAGFVRAVARECWRESFAFIDQHLHRARRRKQNAELAAASESAA